MSENPTAPAFVLGRRSKQRLADCHRDMSAVVERAIRITCVDFAVLETLRTEKKQRRMLREGKSKTQNSRHLGKVPKNTPELGEIAHAVDLVAWVDGKPNWEWEHYFIIANAMKQAAEELGIGIKWSGCWDYLIVYGSAEQANDAYISREKAEGEKPKDNGLHFRTKEPNLTGWAITIKLKIDTQNFTLRGRGRKLPRCLATLGSNPLPGFSSLLYRAQKSPAA
ncbi:hypothetical protein [Neptuniibacter sp.]|uniref:hypothetical protein n=1 Tax=Neptuniibacter sp. TaxID=1962643 RepID=UPI0026180BB5|nr:hypothetical protein [Neptuniibacter sp.]